MTTQPAVNTQACAWCGDPVRPSAAGRRPSYCSTRHQKAMERYRRDRPAIRARLSELEHSAEGYRDVPIFLRNEIVSLREWLRPEDRP